jgi:hypothetical protein
MDRLDILIQEALIESPAGPHFPSAHYLESLDTIMILTHRCEYWKIPHGRTMTMLQDNNSEPSGQKPVGFFLHFAKPFCQNHELITGGRANVENFLVAVATDFPEVAQDLELISQTFGKASPGRSEIWWLD